MRGAPDAGSGTVWVLTLCMVVWFVTGVLLLTASLRVDRHRAATAADLAAVAAAQAVDTPQPCAQARDVAAANRAHLRDCRVSGPTVTVTVAVEPRLWPYGQLRAQARAGPVDSAGSRLRVGAEQLPQQPQGTVLAERIVATAALG